jgi:hypothetical protein
MTIEVLQFQSLLYCDPKHEKIQKTFLDFLFITGDVDSKSFKTT